MCRGARYVALQIVMVCDGFTTEVNSGFKRNSTGWNRIRCTDWDCLLSLLKHLLYVTVGGVTKVQDAISERIVWSF